jgi:hypothetical protein
VWADFAAALDGCNDLYRLFNREFRFFVMKCLPGGIPNGTTCAGSGAYYSHYDHKITQIYCTLQSM